MSHFPTPPAADPLYIFGPHSPIDPTFMRLLLETLLSTQPGYAGASPDRQADLRLATMHALATCRPEDPLEATLAAQLVATNARVMECYRRAALPDAEDAEARRDGTQAASLLRCAAATLCALQRQQATRRKEAEQPSERAGYWFHDVSVPARDDEPDEEFPPNAEYPMRRENSDRPAPQPAPLAAARRVDPMHLNDDDRRPARAAATDTAPGPGHPMPSGEPRPPFVIAMPARRSAAPGSAGGLTGAPTQTAQRPHAP